MAGRNTCDVGGSEVDANGIKPSSVDRPCHEADAEQRHDCVPVVLVDRVESKNPFPTVAVDNRQAGHLGGQRGELMLHPFLLT